MSNLFLIIFLIITVVFINPEGVVFVPVFDMIYSNSRRFYGINYDVDYEKYYSAKWPIIVGNEIN